MLYLYKTNEVVTRYHNVTQLDEHQRALILAYLQGMVNMWITINGTKIFAVRDFVGGQNYYWGGTPLISIWNDCQATAKQKYPNADQEEIDKIAHAQSAIAAGHFLKRVLIESKHNFTENKGVVKNYAWQGE